MLRAIALVESAAGILAAAGIARSGVRRMMFGSADYLAELGVPVGTVKGRLARGSASSAHAAEMVNGLEPLAALALAEAQKARL